VWFVNCLDFSSEMENSKRRGREDERELEKMEMENSKRREGKGKRSEVFLDGESEKMEIVWKR